MMKLRITKIRIISQIFFFLLFSFLAVVNTFGTEWFQKRGWPTNFFFNLDPLIAFTTALSTHKLFAPLAWSLIILLLTLILGRFFCGWICPFGAMHHFIGWAFGPRKTAQRIKANQYRRWFSVKYAILIAMILMAVGIGPAGLQIGLLDPFCLFHRSVTTVVLPLADQPVEKIYAITPYYQNSFLITAILLTLLSLNVLIPRFFCRTLCPLGALLGLLSRFAIFRIERNTTKCTSCKRCQTDCAGACDPHESLRLSECLVCFNCLDSCPEDALHFAAPNNNPEIASPRVSPDISRRQALTAAVAGVVAIPAARLTGATTRNWNPAVIRPPGSLPEEQFLQACLKCGQCMRVCPTNVLQPAGLEAGIEGLWTPILNNRIGKGCMLDCTACSHACPTAAITPISIERKRGLGQYKDQGPIRLGTAFIDRGRCLPWAMDRPCGVCEEVCPVSPKAIFLRIAEETVPPGPMTIKSASPTNITIAANQWQNSAYATGDHICEITTGPGTGQHRPIAANTQNTLTISADQPFNPAPTSDSQFIIKVRLPRPHVDPARCIGCGTCQHECPVSGRRAIRVSAENESRSKDRSLLLRP